MAVIELCEAVTAAAAVVKEAERARGTKTAPRKAATGRTVEIAEDAAAQSRHRGGCGRGPRGRVDAEDAPGGRRGRRRRARRTSTRGRRRPGGPGWSGARGRAPRPWTPQQSTDEDRRQITPAAGPARPAGPRLRGDGLLRLGGPAGSAHGGRRRCRVRWRPCCGCRRSRSPWPAEPMPACTPPARSRTSTSRARGCEVAEPAGRCVAARCPGAVRHARPAGVRRAVRGAVATLRIPHQ